MPGLSFPPYRIEGGIAVVSPMGMLVGGSQVVIAPPSPTGLIGDPRTGSWNVRRSENGQLLVGLRSIRPLMHSSLRVGLTVTSTTSSRCEHTSTGGRLLFFLLLSCGDSIRGSGDGSLNNRSSAESIIVVHRISEVGTEIGIQHYTLPVPVTNQ